jgi:hypothetical protein
MSKSRRNYKWYDRDNEDDDSDFRRKISDNRDRRNQKKMKNALRAKSLDVGRLHSFDDEQ